MFVLFVVLCVLVELMELEYGCELAWMCCLSCPVAEKLVDVCDAANQDGRR